MKENTTYTEEDFKTAVFARHQSGVVAARFYDRGDVPWLTADEISLSNEDMADLGWVPVREAYENDGRVKRLKRHISDVEAVVKRRGEDIERLEAEKAELREHVARLKKARPITIDALRAAWEGAEVANECNEGDILIYRHPESQSEKAEVWSAMRPGVMWAHTRILHRAPKREPWQDLADVLRAHTGEPDPDGTAKMLHERGVRMTEEMSAEYA